MKTLISLIVFTTASQIAYAEDAAQKAEKFYQQGLASERQGDPAAALAAYKAAVELNSNHTSARYRAGEVKTNPEAIKAAGKQAKVGSIMLPAYQIDDATVQEAVALLTLAIEKQQKEGDAAINFIVEDTNKKLENVRINLNLKNIPVSAVLHYIHTQANTKIRYDEHAVVLSAR
jgi:hypothetical protein